TRPAPIGTAGDGPYGTGHASIGPFEDGDVNTTRSGSVPPPGASLASAGGYARAARGRTRRESAPAQLLPGVRSTRDTAGFSHQSDRGPALRRTGMTHRPG